jgi:hypothetical protein
MIIFAVTSRCDIAHTLREQLGANLSSEPAIPGLWTFEGQPTFHREGLRYWLA